MRDSGNAGTSRWHLGDAKSPLDSSHDSLQTYILPTVFLHDPPDDMWVTDEVSFKAKVRTAEEWLRLWYSVSGKADRGNVNHVLSGNEAYHRILISHAYLSKIMPLRWKQSNGSNLVGKTAHTSNFYWCKADLSDVSSSKSDCTPSKLFADCKWATAPHRVTVCNVAVLDRLTPKLSREHQGCCVSANRAFPRFI